MRVEVLTGAELDDVLDDVARLRITVFHAFPYLYDGDFEYERSYLQTYRDSENAVLVGAFDGDKLVGAATGAPMIEHASDFAQAFEKTGLDLESIFYCAESVLLPEYRGLGIGHQFFDQREAHGRKLGKSYSCFCSVMRADDHPMKPEGYRPLNGFWRKRGYDPLPGVVAHFKWKERGQTEQTDHDLQFWMREL